jgi:hypothetical protein
MQAVQMVCMLQGCHKYKTSLQVLPTYDTLCVLLFFTDILTMQRTELTMTSKAWNLNAGLKRLVWKEGENSTPTDFCATVSSTPQRERRSRFHYLGCNQLCMTSCEWYERFSHMTDCQMGSDFGKILNRPKEMNAVCTKVLLKCFPPVCPFVPSIFSPVTPRHVLHL